MGCQSAFVIACCQPATQSPRPTSLQHVPAPREADEQDTAWGCMSKRTATFDMQRIPAAMNGRTCRKRRPNLTCTRFAESGQQVSADPFDFPVPSSAPQRSAGCLPPYHPPTPDPAMQTESWCSLSIRETPATSVNRMNPGNFSESHQVQW